MALAGLAPDVMKPAALMLNIPVAGVAAWRFARAGPGGPFGVRVFGSETAVEAVSASAGRDGKLVHPPGDPRLRFGR